MTNSSPVHRARDGAFYKISRACKESGAKLRTYGRQLLSADARPVYGFEGATARDYSPSPGPASTSRAVAPFFSTASASPRLRVRCGKGSGGCPHARTISGSSRTRGASPPLDTPEAHPPTEARFQGGLARRRARRRRARASWLGFSLIQSRIGRRAGSDARDS